MKKEKIYAENISVSLYPDDRAMLDKIVGLRKEETGFRNYSRSDAIREALSLYVKEIK